MKSPWRSVWSQGVEGTADGPKNALHAPACFPNLGRNARNSAAEKILRYANRYADLKAAPRKIRGKRRDGRVFPENMRRCSERSAGLRAGAALLLLGAQLLDL